MAVELRAADLLVMDAVEKADRGAMTDADAAMVKLYCSEMLGRAADCTVQIYGGMGLMEELPVQRLWRDAHAPRRPAYFSERRRVKPGSDGSIKAPQGVWNRGRSRIGRSNWSHPSRPRASTR